jgi:hypothetical protein
VKTFSYIPSPQKKKQKKPKKGKFEESMNLGKDNSISI